jgi:hypothetical protein
MRDVLSMSTQDKIAEAMRRSLPLLPAAAREQVQAMLSPESLAIIAATVALWAGSHFFGVGELVDIILLVTGFALLGLSVISGAEELYKFATQAAGAHSEADLDQAAGHLRGPSTSWAFPSSRPSCSTAARGPSQHAAHRDSGRMSRSAPRPRRALRPSPGPSPCPAERSAKRTGGGISR